MGDRLHFDGHAEGAKISGFDFSIVKTALAAI